MTEVEGARARPEGSARAWLWAMLLAVLAHGTFLGTLRSIRLPERMELTARPTDGIEVQLVPAPAAAPEPPRVFTEQPDDGSSNPPERADFLGNVDATAQDRVPGGEDALPASPGRADAPQVALVPQAPLPAEPAAEPEPPGTDPDPAEAALANPDDAAPVVPAAVPPTLAEALRAAAGRDRPAKAGAPGNSDILQEAMDSAANAAGAGDIRLSTTAWDYAPWLQAFRRALLERWHPPQAFFLGLIEGWAVVEVEIGRDGRMLRVDVLQEDVDHWSLTDAAVNAIRRAAPYRPLPATFPEATLRVQIRFSYAGTKR